MPQIYANEYSYYNHLRFRGYIVTPPMFVYVMCLYFEIYRISDIVQQFGLFLFRPFAIVRI